MKHPFVQVLRDCGLPPDVKVTPDVLLRGRQHYALAFPGNRFMRASVPEAATPEQMREAAVETVSDAIHGLAWCS